MSCINVNVTSYLQVKVKVVSEPPLKILVVPTCDLATDFLCCFSGGLWKGALPWISSEYWNSKK